MKDTPLKDSQRLLSPRRNTTQATDIGGLVQEQLAHFAIEPDTPFGRQLGAIATHLYTCQHEVDLLWETTIQEMASLQATDRVARFNALKFLSFQSVEGEQCLIGVFLF